MSISQRTLLVIASDRRTASYAAYLYHPARDWRYVRAIEHIYGWSDVDIMIVRPIGSGREPNEAIERAKRMEALGQATIEEVWPYND